MFYGLTWLLVTGLIALWSLGAWAVHATAAWSLANVGALAGGGALQDIVVPDWLAPWIPPDVVEALASMAASFAPAITALLDWAPTLTSGLSALVWVLWACGTVLLVVVGIALSVLVKVMRRKATGNAANAPHAGA